MILELTGPSGSGKTTLRERIVDRGEGLLQRADEVLLAGPAEGPGGERTRNLRLDLRVLPHAVPELVLQRRVLFAVWRLAWGTRPSPERWCAILRSCARKLVLGRLLAKWERWRTWVVVDEGVEHLLQVAACNGRQTPPAHLLLQLARRLPSTATLCLVTAEVAVLVRRVLARPDRPLRGASLEELARFLARSLWVTRAVESRLPGRHHLVVDGTVAGQAGLVISRLRSMLAHDRCGSRPR